MFFAFIGWLPCGAAASASLEFARILVIKGGAKQRELEILEFPSFFTAATVRFRGQHKSRIP